MKLIKIFLAIFITVFFLNAQVSAQESADTAAEPSLSVEESEMNGSADEKYLYPVMPPEIMFYGGFRLVSDSGATTADEYEYLHNSLLLGGDLRYFSFPHRFHLNVDVENGKDYYGDVSYAYEDIIVFRGINRTLYHNLDNYRFYDGDTSTANYKANDDDNAEKYGVRVGMNSVNLRFKTHDFPFHIYVEAGLIERKGTQQQISLLGTANSPTSGVRTSLPRSIDFQTKTLTIGANSHLGPVEIDLSHGEKRFSVSGDAVMYDQYSAVSDGSSSTRPASRWPRAAGEWAHNLIPEIKSSSNTIKIHTSYTGAIVGSATISKIERENQDSGAKASLLIGAGDISWTASPKLAFFFKYHYRDNDVENPDYVQFMDRTGLISSALYSKDDGYMSLKDSISSVTNAVTGIVRYRPVTGVMLKGEYTYEDIHRSNADEWGKAVAATSYAFPESTTKNVTSLSADLRLIKGLNLKLKYNHKDINNPAYNVEPDSSDEGRVSVSWVPVPRISTLLSYGIVKEKRDNLEGLSVEAENRKVLRDKLFGSVTFLVLRDLSLTTSYSYIHNRTEQDIGIGSVTDNIPNKIFAHTYGIDLNYAPKSNLTLGAGMNYTLSSGKFFPSDEALLNPSVADFSALRTEETVVYLSGEYRFRHGFSVGMQYKFTRLNDAIDNIYDDVMDGKAHIVFLTLSKKW